MYENNYNVIWFSVLICPLGRHFGKNVALKNKSTGQRVINTSKKWDFHDTMHTNRGNVIRSYSRCSKISLSSCLSRKPRQTDCSADPDAVWSCSSQFDILTSILWTPTTVNVLCLDKQCRPRSDCFFRSSLISIFPAWYSDKHFVNSSHENQLFIWEQKEKRVQI